MVAAVVCLALVAIAALAAAWQLQRSHVEAQAQWALERRELLNRIQAPQHIPLASPDGFVFPEPEDDGTNLVGTIAEPKPEDLPAA